MKVQLCFVACLLVLMTMDKRNKSTTLAFHSGGNFVGSFPRSTLVPLIVLIALIVWIGRYADVFTSRMEPSVPRILNVIVER